MSFISVSDRAYKYIRQFTIKSIEDALVELITNCFDAYRKTTTTDKVVIIDLINDEKIIVRDHALGLTSEQLQSCFLQIGNKTSEDSSRGFFSRGAKDITALGNLTFDTIKDKKYSQCKLSTDVYGEITVQDIDVTEEILKNMCMKNNINGLSVTIELLPNYKSLEPTKIYTSISKNGTLRDLVSNPSNNITIRKFIDNTNVFEQRVLYEYPPGELLLDIEYIIPNYPNEFAKFVVYKANKPINKPLNESQLEFGFLIKDDTSVYEVSTIDNKYRWNPYMNYIYGYLQTNAIRKYLLDYDTNGSSISNPFPIIDPSRISGVNKQHPLIINLFSIATVRIDSILRNLNSSVSAKSIAIDDIETLIDELSKYGLEIAQANNVDVNFSPTYDGELIRAIKNDRANFVTYEKSYEMNGNYTNQELELDNYIKEQLISYDNGSYHYLDSKNQLVQLQITDPGDELGPVNIMKLIPSEIKAELRDRPYLYKLSDNGTVDKLYIYNKGDIDTVLESDANKLSIKKKQFNIQFINDININERYIIDNSDGITIKINLNNPLVSKYLTNKDAKTIDDLITMDKISSTQSLIFLQEMITGILTDLIIQNDIQNQKVIFDQDVSNSTKKILDYRNQVITRIENTVNNMFAKYINTSQTTKMSVLFDNIDNLNNIITQKFIDAGVTDVTNINNLTDDIKNKISKQIE